MNQIICGVVLCTIFLLQFSLIQAGSNPYQWRCGGKGINSVHVWAQAVDNCRIYRGLCRELCVLQKIKALSNNLAWQEKETKEIIAGSVDPRHHDNLFQGIKRCIPYIVDTDRSEFYMGNRFFLDCLNREIVHECSVPFNHFQFSAERPTYIVHVAAPPAPSPQGWFSFLGRRKRSTGKEEDFVSRV